MGTSIVSQMHSVGRWDFQ